MVTDDMQQLDLGYNLKTRPAQFAERLNVGMTGSAMSRTVQDYGQGNRNDNKVLTEMKKDWRSRWLHVDDSCGREVGTWYFTELFFFSLCI